MRSPQSAPARNRPGCDEAYDRALLQQIAHGSESAFGELHLRYRERVARFASRRATRPHMVEEITNDTLWAVWQGAQRFRGTSKVSTWIFGIAHHTSLRALGQESRHSRAGDLLSPGEESHTPHSDDEIGEWVAAALAQLPSSQRVVLELAYLSGLSCVEISHRVSCPVNTVKTRMFHGRRKMRQSLLQLAE